MKNALFQAHQRYSIRKYSVGVASVLIGMTLFANGQAVSADQVATPATTDVESSQLVEEKADEPVVNLPESASDTKEVGTTSLDLATETKVAPLELTADKQTVTEVSSLPVLKEEASTNEAEAKTQNVVDAKSPATPADQKVPAVVEASTEEVLATNPSSVNMAAVQHDPQPVKKVAEPVVKPVEKTNLKVADLALADVKVARPASLSTLAVSARLADGTVASKSVSEPAPVKATTVTSVPKSGQSTFFSAVNTSQARGDDYPSYLKKAEKDSILDPWHLYNRESPSFVAYRLSTVNHYTIKPAYGMARDWGSRARREGVTVDQTPAVGSVAWFQAGYGNVAWVSNVIGGHVEIEEYNWENKGGYHKRVVPVNSVTGFIHFKDLANKVSTASTTRPAQPAAKPVTKPAETEPATKAVESKAAASKSSLASRGTYHFTGRADIKAEAKVSAPTLAYYDKGQSVNYDKTLQADGHEWISYLSYSGHRRYIAVGTVTLAQPTKPAAKPVTKPAETKPATKPVDNKPAVSKSSLASRGTYHFTGRADIKAEARVGAPVLAYYDKGQSVNYDKTLQADGHEWISYLSYSGHRRYIAVSQLAPAQSAKPAQPAQPVTKPSETKPATKAVESQAAASKSSLASRGTYHFTGRADIKAEARVGAPVLAYYDKGQSVNYDKTLQADGHEWISYLSYSGHRRYIAVSQLAPAPVAVQPVATPSHQVAPAATAKAPTKSAPVSASHPRLATSGTYRFTDRSYITNQASAGAPALAYYNPGQSVHYDQVIEKDGHQWISYLTYSGHRRYIQVH